MGKDPNVDDQQKRKRIDAHRGQLRNRVVDVTGRAGKRQKSDVRGVGNGCRQIESGDFGQKNGDARPETSSGGA